MAAELPDATLHVFPGQGHLPVFTAPEDFCLALRRLVGAGDATG